MQLGLTIPLQRRLKVSSLPPAGECSRFFCWDLHAIPLCGQNSLLAVHCASRYVFTLFSPSPAEWQNLPETFLKGLRQSFRAASIAASQTERYLIKAGPPALTKTHGRREVAFLNRAWEDVVDESGALNRESLFQPLLDRIVNELPCRCAAGAGRDSSLSRLQSILQTRL